MIIPIGLYILSRRKVDYFISYIVVEKQNGLSDKDLTKVFYKAGEV
jgi:hypothetical protein